MFLAQNARQTEQQASRTTTFLAEQLAEAKTKFDQEDRKTSGLQTSTSRLITGRHQPNLGILMSTNSQLDATTQALSRARPKALNESLLQQEEANWKTRTTGQPNPDSADAPLTLLQDQLSSLLSRYTPDHPDVIKTQNQIAELKKRMAEPSKPAPANAPRNQGMSLHKFNCCAPS